jgi:hypothetical protein
MHRPGCAVDIQHELMQLAQVITQGVHLPCGIPLADAYLFLIGKASEALTRFSIAMRCGTMKDLQCLHL